MLALACLILVTGHSLHVTNAAVTPRHDADMHPIHFPGPIKGVGTKKNDVPDECKDKTYCTIKPPGFPEENFNKMFKGMKIPIQPSLVLDSMLSNRQGDPDETNDCDSEVTYEPLYTIRAKRDGEWRYVVQAPEENYVQRVRLETCKNPEGPCFNIFPPTSDIKTFCKQKYNKWEIMVSKGDNETEKIETELPVCCSCHYKSAPIETRFGVPNTMTPIKKP